MDKPQLKLLRTAIEKSRQIVVLHGGYGTGKSYAVGQAATRAKADVRTFAASELSTGVQIARVLQALSSRTCRLDGLAPRGQVIVVDEFDTLPVPNVITMWVNCRKQRPTHHTLILVCSTAYNPCIRGLRADLRLTMPSPVSQLIKLEVVRKSGISMVNIHEWVNNAKNFHQLAVLIASAKETARPCPKRKRGYEDTLFAPESLVGSCRQLMLYPSARNARECSTARE
jgi:hypothetical protein